MPEISRFYGIVIQMYFGDHPPPHFHALYAGDRVVVNISNLSVIEGRLPPRALGLVVEWASLHREELLEAFATAQSLNRPSKIDPLP